MKYEVEVRKLAERDVAEAIDWYARRLPELGASFFEEFDAVLVRLSEAPLIYQAVYRESRRVQMHRFPYLVWFKVKGNVVTVRACLRGSIKPGRVRKRVR